MQFQITQIEFDFDDDLDPLTDEEIKEIYDDHIGMIVEADDEEDLVDEITTVTGWCIKSIDYIHVLK